jgi:hypothetical protein
VNALPLLLVLGTLAPAAGDDDLRDVLTDAKGRETRGRLVERYHPKRLVLQVGSKYEQLDRGKYTVATTVRDNLETFMKRRAPGLSVDEDFALIAYADSLELPAMARLQAWHVLARDPVHVDAHEYLGHEQRRGAYSWPHESSRKGLAADEFISVIRAWPTRLKLESEHFVVETDTTLERCVDMLFDLERVYLEWMRVFGPMLEAAEGPRDLGEKMVVRVFHMKDDPGFSDNLTQEREPWYSASRAITMPDGNPSIAFTWYEIGADHPYRFFDLAVQQLMYTTLVAGKKRGNVPANDYTRHAHWAEWGMGYWFGSQFAGPPGHVARRPFTPDPKVNEVAREHTERGPLRLTKDEVTNLVGLSFGQFYGTADEVGIHRAKSRSFFAFLMEVDPPLTKRDKQVGSGRRGILGYLREVYGTPTGHSSSKLDDAMGGKIQLLEPAWEGWRAL